ncbi:MAG: TRASH domain-containing protein [Pseudodesulfovibrio sp.]|uniref:TRASH domain-containing protein n=1 Tax=Pseudodesulfovibrio sp. TaxID=2035812 RepID=UPI003D11FBFD
MTGIKIILFAAVLLTAFAGFSLVGTRATPSRGNQSLCPVMGFEIDRNIFSDYRSKRIYLCCPSCPSEFKKDPEKYVKQMQANGVLLEDVTA